MMPLGTKNLTAPSQAPSQPPAQPGRRRAAALAEKHWHRYLAALIEMIGQPNFTGALVNAMSHVVFFDHMVIFSYQGDQRPYCLYDTFTPEQRWIFVSLYEDGPYLLDPFFQAGRSGIKPGLYRMRQFAPDRFYQSEYYRSYYIKTGLAEEVGFFFPLKSGETVVLSLMRAEASSAFSDHDISRLQIIEPVIRAICQQHWPDSGRDQLGLKASDSTPLDLDQVVTSIFQSLGPASLTHRECEITSLVLQGHSSESIGQLLHISRGTVKIHRKNAYRKLGITSQSQLFSLFLTAFRNNEKDLKPA
ncbi:MAG TPA: helix-turn-helix transcriptional regulator [Terriglobia bacterium]|nr:helix-turn-helix transcriptional regulator [Terriglobia bacterium]